jgi:hypothetical protein
VHLVQVMAMVMVGVMVVSTMLVLALPLVALRTTARMAARRTPAILMKPALALRRTI